MNDRDQRLTRHSDGEYRITSSTPAREVRRAGQLFPAPPEWWTSDHAREIYARHGVPPNMELIAIAHPGGRYGDQYRNFRILYVGSPDPRPDEEAPDYPRLSQRNVSRGGVQHLILWLTRITCIDSPLAIEYRYHLLISPACPAETVITDMGTAHTQEQYLAIRRGLDLLGLILSIGGRKPKAPGADWVPHRYADPRDFVDAIRGLYHLPLEVKTAEAIAHLLDIGEGTFRKLRHHHQIDLEDIRGKRV